MFSENRYPLFGIMLYCVTQLLAITRGRQILAK
jgi:hypothetical protein